MTESNTPESVSPELVREANEFCGQISSVAELMKVSIELGEIAQRAASTVTQRSMFGNLPFKMEVHLPATTDAYVVVDDNVVESKPLTFKADEIRSIGKFGVEFYNRDKDAWLKIKGYDFEVNPVFEESPTQAS